MGESCPKCRRESRTGSAQEVGERYYDYCWAVDGTACRVAAAGYRRGIDEGVRLAKAYIFASISSDHYPRPILNWTGVDKAAAAAKEERWTSEQG